jgi:hypothetical protein
MRTSAAMARAPDGLREILTGSPQHKHATKQRIQRGGFEGSLQFRNTRLARPDQTRDPELLDELAQQVIVTKHHGFSTVEVRGVEGPDD